MGLCVAEDTCLRDKKAEWDGTSKEREENSALRATPTGWTKTLFLEFATLPAKVSDAGRPETCHLRVLC